MAERDGVAHHLGAALLGHADIMLLLWCRVRDGTLAFADFQEAMSTIIQAVGAGAAR